MNSHTQARLTLFGVVHALYYSNKIEHEKCLAVSPVFFYDKYLSFISFLVDELIKCSISASFFVTSTHQYIDDTIFLIRSVGKLPAQRSSGHGVTYPGSQVGYGGSCVVPCDVRASSVCSSRSRPAAGDLRARGLDAGRRQQQLPEGAGCAEG
jgi:hypothetical protein